MVLMRLMTKMLPILLILLGLICMFKGEMIVGGLLCLTGNIVALADQIARVTVEVRLLQVLIMEAHEDTLLAKGSIIKVDTKEEP